MPQGRHSGTGIRTTRRAVCTDDPSKKGNTQKNVNSVSRPSRDQVKILHKCKQESKISELMKIVSRTNRTKFRDQVLNTLMKAGLLEMTFPDKPRSSKQKYRLTKRGAEYLKKQ